jgi:hypothetical protein
MTYEAANAGLDQIIDRTCTQLLRYRSHDRWEDDDLFIRGLVQQFVDQAARAPHGAGAISMALSAYRLAVMHLEVKALRDSIDMRDCALELMWAIGDEEEHLDTSD